MLHAADQLRRFVRETIMTPTSLNIRAQKICLIGFKDTVPQVLRSSYITELLRTCGPNRPSKHKITGNIAGILLPLPDTGFSSSCLPHSQPISRDHLVVSSNLLRSFVSGRSPTLLPEIWHSFIVCHLSNTFIPS
jgi:hypothetical protein